jgi:hypothetical protein
VPKPEIRRGGPYKPVKGDLVDEIMATYINAMTNPLPVKRLGDGYYLFGTKKIYARLMNE